MTIGKNHVRSVIGRAYTFNKFKFVLLKDDGIEVGYRYINCNNNNEFTNMSGRFEGVTLQPITFKEYIKSI